MESSTYNKKTSLGKRIYERRRPKTEIVVDMITGALKKKKYIPDDYRLIMLDLTYIKLDI